MFNSQEQNEEAMTERKLAIVQAAIKLFAERGYDATPVSEIARAAGVSEGAIFRHFKTKEDLLFHLFRGIREGFFADIEREFKFSNSESGLEMVVRLIRLYCRFCEIRELEFDFIHRNNPYHMPFIGDPCRAEIQRIHDKMIDLLKMGITLGIRDGSIRKVPVVPSAMLIIGLLAGTVRMRIFEQLHLKDLEPQVIEFCKHALQSLAPPST
jgi:TetR/AcrR family fatty acid metabolism transcriptional regulator